MSVGGWTAGSGVYSQIAANQNARSNFAKSVLDILNKHGFDGEGFFIEIVINFMKKCVIRF